MNHKRILFLGTQADKNFLPFLKGCVGTASVALILDTPSTFTELGAVCKAKNATAIVSSSPQLLSKLIEASAHSKRKPSIDNYAGSLFKIPIINMECVFINPLEQLMTVPYGKFLASRYISKLVSADSWFQSTKFNWEMFDESTFEVACKRFATAEAIACDIETFSNPPSIRSISFTGLFFRKEGYTSSTIVIPCDSLYNLACIRSMLQLPIPKIFQNGKYDLSYLSAYDAAPNFYLWDTIQLFHSWYSELPKDLASLNSFFVRDSMYWKDLADTSDLQQFYYYNALDTWATANAFLAWMAEAPKYARDNYANTFPLQFPCHLSEMTGIARDMDEMAKAASAQNEIVAMNSKALDTMLGVTGFNVNSSPQMKSLFRILGCGDMPSQDSMHLTKAAQRHPLNKRIVNAIIKVRKSRKLLSTYITEGKEFYGHLGQYKPAADGEPTNPRSRQGRILYSLNPHGTDTSRLASKESHFWCGLQIHNIPRGRIVKRTLVRDNGFVIIECDLKQAESVDTAFISGDKNLIAAVTSTRDFHSVNASAFFGIPYDVIYSETSGTVLDKTLRDLAKRVNHGANYLMGAQVMLDTMGEENVLKAKRLLKLPPLMTLIQVTEYLLEQFHKAYPGLRKHFYTGVVHEISTTKMLRSTAIHDCPYQAAKSGLVRYCFGDPSKSKRMLNSYVAHVPQSLNSQTLNKAYMRVFYDIALNPTYSSHFKLLAQIHDSILFQVRKDYIHLAERVKDCMEIPVTITGYDAIKRTFTVSSSIKAGSDSLGANSWGDTE